MKFHLPPLLYAKCVTYLLENLLTNSGQYIPRLRLSVPLVGKQIFTKVRNILLTFVASWNFERKVKTSSTKIQLIFQGEKKRDAGGTNEIVACTNCGGGSSPCTHSANNGCATEVLCILYIFVNYHHSHSKLSSSYIHVLRFFISDMLRASTEKGKTTSNKSG